MCLLSVVVYVFSSMDMTLIERVVTMLGIWLQMKSIINPRSQDLNVSDSVVWKVIGLTS